MLVLFVHGMGRSPASGWLLLRALRRSGFRTATFGYSVSRESFAQIAARLASTLQALPEQEELVLIGHSLGGVLLRHVLGLLDASAKQVRHLFLLGSPVAASKMAVRFAGNPLFRAITRDCGRLLGSAERMAAIASAAVPATGIAGTRGIVGLRGPFGVEPNDGIVSVSEVSAAWLQDQVLVPVMHTLLPSDRRVAAVILQRLGRSGT